MPNLISTNFIAANPRENSHIYSCKSESRHISPANKLKNFLQKERALDKLLAALHLFAALNKSINAIRDLNDIVKECNYLKLIKPNAQFELTENEENIKDLAHLLSANEIEDCKKSVHESLLKEILPNQNEQVEVLSFQDLLNKWLTLIDEICCESYTKNLEPTEELLKNNKSIVTMNFNSIVGMTTYCLQYLNILDNRYKNLSINLKKSLTIFISSISGSPAWKKIQGINNIFIPQLILHLSKKEIMMLRLVDSWFYYEMTRDTRDIEIYAPDQTEKKFNAFASIGIINKITLAKAEKRTISYYSEDIDKIVSMLKNFDTIDRVKDINFSGCNLNEVGFLKNFTEFTGLENIEMQRVNLLPVQNPEKIPGNAFFSTHSGFKNITSIEIRNSYISRFLIISLSHLPQLRKLVLSNNDFWPEKNNPSEKYSDDFFSFLRSFKQLQRLELLTEKVEFSNNILSYLKELELLEYLSLAFCNGINDEGLKIFFENNLKKIKELIFAYCPNVTDEGIRSLSKGGLNKLENLELCFFENLTDDSLTYIDEIKSLKHLYLLNCQKIKSESVQNLNDTSSHLKVLHEQIN